MNKLTYPGQDGTFVATNRTRVTRSWSTTRKYLGGAIGCGVLSVAMFATIVVGPITTGFALIPGILSLMFFYGAVALSATARCPGCDASLDGMSTGKNDGKCCTNCHRYIEGRKGELWLTELTRIADTPLFTTRLGEHFRWPEGCCVCGATATRKLPVNTTMPAYAKNAMLAIATGGSLLVTGGGKKLTVPVPHCDSHDNGAFLPSPSSPEDLRIMFRSYPYLRAFCEKNHTQPE